MDVKGQAIPGQLHDLKSAVKVKPYRLHCAVQPSQGTRLLLAAHTVGGWRKLKPDEVQILNGLGFQIPDQEDEGYLAKRAMAEEHKEASNLPWAVEYEDTVHSFGEKDSPAEAEEDIVRCAKAAAEKLYTHGVEEILEALQDELRVVHTVHPREVDQHLPKWVQALKTEMSTLEDIGAIKRLTGQAAKDFLNLQGVQVVPGKAVYTVKPPSKEGTKYRRKMWKFPSARSSRGKLFWWSRRSGCPIGGGSGFPVWMDNLYWRCCECFPSSTGAKGDAFGFETTCSVGSSRTGAAR